MPSDPAPPAEFPHSPGTFTFDQRKSTICPIANQRATPFLRAIEHCLGSPCSLWRWDHYYHPGGSIHPSTTHGYCGLGGRP